MAESAKSFKHESIEDRESLVAYLQSLAQAIQEGQLTLSSGERSLQLHPTGMIQFRLDGKRGSHRHRLHLRMSWRSESRVDPAVDPKLNIGASGKTA